MRCPVCPEVDLVMAERQGVEIDYCPQCRGVWLDRGELDKIIERSQSVETRYATDQGRDHHDDHDHDDHDDHDSYRRGHSDRPRRRRGGFLGELFEFGD